MSSASVQAVARRIHDSNATLITIESARKSAIVSTRIVRGRLNAIPVIAACAAIPPENMCLAAMPPVSFHDLSMGREIALPLRWGGR